MSVLTFCHSGNLGDLLWHLPAMVDIAKRQGNRQFKLFLKVNVPARYNEAHPCGPVLMTREFAESALPLLRAQPYIADADIWSGQPVDVEMDLFRFSGGNMMKGDIATWPCMAHLCSPDLTKPWLTVPPLPWTDHILVSRTSRHRNPAIVYPRIGYFVGLEEENERDLPWVRTPTLLELAQEIERCRFFIGNQSLAFAIASALDVPRILEWCPNYPNVQPHTPNCTPVWTQAQLDEAIRFLDVHFVSPPPVSVLAR